MKKAGIAGLLFISAFCFGQEAGFYNGTEGKSGDDLKSVLHETINGHVDFSYSDAKWILNYADEDPAVPGNVILFYTKRSQGNDTWGSGGNFINREHVWAKSHGSFADIRPMDGDAFNLHPADASVNLDKSNYDFDECSASGTYIAEADAYYTSSQFEPQDAAKGEVARTIFYMAVRYEGTNGELDLEAVDDIGTSPKAEHGKLSTLLQWNNDFPPTELERRRNERVYHCQRNRNPFIDNPNFANLIWGGASPSEITIGGLSMAEDHPLAGSSTSFSATITGNTESTLYYGTNWDSEASSSAMTQAGDVWTGTLDLSGFSAGDKVYYKLEAGNGSTTETIHGTYLIPEVLSLTNISDVQGTGNSTPLNNSVVSIGGIITANFDNTYYMQNGSDARAGIAVYGIQRGHIGDSIVVTGKATEYNNLTELTDVSYTYVYKKNTPIDPAVITIADADEDYEGCLVKFNNVTFLEGDTEIPLDQSKELHFTDGNNTLNVYCRYNSRLGGKTVPSGTVNVTGVLSQYQGNYQLLIHSIDYIEMGEDNDPPLLSGIVVNDAYWIEVSFSEKLDKTIAETVSNYSISGGVVITGAYLYNDTKVLLLVEGLQEQDYTLTVNNIEDLQGNAITEASMEFHSDYTSVSIQKAGTRALKLYPNPASDVLCIEFPDSQHPEWIQFTDMNGRIVAEYCGNPGKNVRSFDVSTFTPGLYMIHFRSGISRFHEIVYINN